MTAPFDRAAPRVQHHVVNSLGLADLRPLQAAAIEPVLAGDDCLLLAPTAGGKTEAAVFPLLSRMADERWTGTSVLYVCPLRALLNNLQPRLDGYAGWLGRPAALWHGDIGQAARRRILLDPPDILLTTPESLEAMLVSTTSTPDASSPVSAAVVVDEVHAFAGDDRGWHLLPCSSGSRDSPAGRSSASGCRRRSAIPTSCWPGCRGRRPTRPRTGRSATCRPHDAVAARSSSTTSARLENAATVIARLHRGEKRLVFVRQPAPRRGARLGAARARGVDDLRVALLAVRGRTAAMPSRRSPRRGTA